MRLTANLIHDDDLYGDDHRFAEDMLDRLDDMKHPNILKIISED